MIGRNPLGGIVAVATLALLGGCDFLGAKQAAFDSPEQAGEALIAAARSGDTSEILRVLGEGAQPVVESGDTVEDANNRNEFVARYAAAHRWVSETPEISTLVIGDDWTFPFPLVNEDDGWRFDATYGVEEILDRRIGENELAAIQASLAYVDAQREYYWSNPDGEPLLHYARHLVSTPGTRDGLFWETSEGEAPSPMGELFVAARSEGYLVDGTAKPVPYYGYHFHSLTAQGEHAAGGAYDYLVGDRLIGGFGLIAYPAERGTSGVMTFIVNHDGVVFSKDLGEDTAKLAEDMTLFDPDPSWKREE